jgi:membrane protein
MDILLRVKDGVWNDRVGTIAAGTTFFLLLSLFPAMAALVSLYGLVADPMMIQQHLVVLNGFVPHDVLDLVGTEMERLATARPDRLGAGFALSVAVAFWSANSGMRAVFDALNLAYGEREKRSYVKLFTVSAAFTAGAVVFFVVVLNVIIGVPIILKVLYLTPVSGILLPVLPATILSTVSSLGIAVLYRYGPSRRRAKWRWITPGSITVAVVWLTTSALFSWYLANVANYSATYGSLGAAVGLMMWIYISIWIVLVGAELNAEIEHQTSEDTTTGPDRPIGERGAAMADRIGEPRA